MQDCVTQILTDLAQCIYSQDEPFVTDGEAEGELLELMNILTISFVMGAFLIILRALIPVH